MKFNYSNPFFKKYIYRIIPLADYVRLLLCGRRVVIHGSYFTTNVGDRAIGLVLKNELAKRGTKSVLVSRFCRWVPWKNIIVGGGGVIHNHYPLNLTLRTAFLTQRKNVIYAGVGCPGFQDPTGDDKKRLTLFRNAAFISVRDRFSAGQLSQSAGVNCRIFSCPAWLWAENRQVRDFSFRNFIFRLYYRKRYPVPGITPGVKGQRIGVVLNGHFDMAHLHAVKEYLGALKRDHSLFFIPFVGEDLEFYEKKIRDLNIPCEKLQGPVETYKMVCSMDRMVVTRYHSLIFSILAQKKVMVLAYSQKVKSLARDLELDYCDLTQSKPLNFSFNHSVNPLRVHEKIELARQQIESILSYLL